MLERFQAEWAFKHGSKYTAFDVQFGGRVRESGEEDDGALRGRPEEIQTALKSQPPAWGRPGL